MNKENEEQPQNAEKPDEEKTPEANAPQPEASGEDQQQAQAQPTEEQASVTGQTPPEKDGAGAKEAKRPEKDERKGHRPKGKRGKGDSSGEDDGDEFIEKVIAINRITKVTKGGKKLSFSALVVVGDTKGHVGYSLSKAAEVAIAIRKAMGVAKKNMVKIPMNGTTIPHEIIGRCSGSRVLLKPASDGTGVIASGPVRAVCDGAGIHNILTKVHRSNNPINVVKATIDGLMRLKSMNEDGPSENTESAEHAVT